MLVHAITKSVFEGYKSTFENPIEKGYADGPRGEWNCYCYLGMMRSPMADLLYAKVGRGERKRLSHEAVHGKSNLSAAFSISGTQKSVTTLRTEFKDKGYSATPSASHGV